MQSFYIRNVSPKTSNKGTITHCGVYDGVIKSVDEFKELMPDISLEDGFNELLVEIGEIKF